MTVKSSFRTKVISEDYTTVDGDKNILVKGNVAALTIIINSRAAWDRNKITIKDFDGQAGTYPITIKAAPVGGALIDGALTYVISTNYGAIDLVCDGLDWGIS